MRALIALLLALLALTTPPARAALHPQDGPHIEIRIAIEDTGVRWTLGPNLAFLDEMIEPARESLQAVSESEREQLLERLARMLRERVRVRIDGEPITPTIELLELHNEPDPSLVGLYPRMRMRALIRGVAVLDFPAPAPPETVELTWPTYPPDSVAAEDEHADNPPAMVIEAQLRAEGTMKMIRFSEADPSVTWHAGWDDAARFEPVPAAPPPIVPTRVPVLTLGLGACAGLAMVWFGVAVARGRPWFSGLMGAVIAGALAWALSGVLLVELPGANDATPPGAGEVEAAFIPMHANLYRAFDYTAETDVYDSLARTVEGPLLEELYTQVRASLVQSEQGEMVGIVTGLHTGRLDLVSSEHVPEGDALVVQATIRHAWRVDGTVYHWGHSHTRQMEYEGEYTLTALPKGWRITHHRILSQTRLDPGADASPTSVEDLLRDLGADDI